MKLSVFLRIQGAGVVGVGLSLLYLLQEKLLYVPRVPGVTNDLVYKPDAFGFKFEVRCRRPPFASHIRCNPEPPIHIPDSLTSSTSDVTVLAEVLKCSAFAAHFDYSCDITILERNSWPNILGWR